MEPKTNQVTKKIQIVGEVVEPASDEEMLDALIEADMLSAVMSDGAILTDKEGNIIIW